MAFKLRMTVDMHGMHTRAHFEDLDLDFDFEKVGKTRSACFFVFLSFSFCVLVGVFPLFFSLSCFFDGTCVHSIIHSVIFVLPCVGNMISPVEKTTTHEEYFENIDAL